MGGYFAIFGEFALPPRFSLASVPVLREPPASGWCGLGAERVLPTTASELLEQLTATTEGVMHLEVAHKKNRLVVDVVVDRDGLFACARKLAVLGRSVGAHGATGTLLFVGFDGPQDAWRLDAATGELTVLGERDEAAARDRGVGRARAHLSALAFAVTSPRGSRDPDAASLRSLAQSDPNAAVARALAVLADPDLLRTRARFAVAEAARDVLVKHAEGDQAVQAAAFFLDALYTKEASGYHAWALDALGRLRGASVAARIASELRVDRFTHQLVGVMKLFGVLVARKEEGDPALMEALASDPWGFFAESALPDELLLRICERASEVRDAARN